ncbi:MAG: DnaJ family domain-containing protein [Verrucomicrobiota bacterium]
MNWSRRIDEEIREKIESREWDVSDLHGKPLSLDDYFAAPEELRLGYSLLKEAGYVPAAVQIRQRVHQVELALEQTQDKERERELQREREALLVRLDLERR